MKKSLLTLAAVLLLVGCKTYKQVPYFQNADSVDLSASKYLYDAKIMPKDALVISVKTTDPQASQPFNLMVYRTVGNDGEVVSGYGSMLTYLVENDGTIDFPIIGRIHVAGLTKRELEDLVKEKISPYLAKNETPVVKVQMASYRVTVMGEVAKPTVVPVTTEKMTILEALAAAGDLTVWGLRENVLLIRENPNGEKETHRLNLTDANLINSPYYYLKQNDVIYVQPNKTKAQNSSMGQSTSTWISVIGASVSVISLVFNILK